MTDIVRSLRLHGGLPPGTAETVDKVVSDPLILPTRAGATQKKTNLQVSTNYERILGTSAALSGDITLVLSSGPRLEVLAADLNAAAASALKRSFAVNLEYSGGKHRWADFAPVLTPTESVADVDVGLPTLAANLKFKKGQLLVEVTFDTDAGATKTYAATGVKAAGSITCVAGANLVDGETVVLTDIDGLAVTFEFDSDGSTSGTNTRVPFTASDTAAQVANALRKTINFSALLITASGTTAVVDVTQNVVGAGGNVAITETVADAGFVAAGFTGGIDTDSVAVQVQTKADDTWITHSVPGVTETFLVV